MMDAVGDNANNNKTSEVLKAQEIQSRGPYPRQVEIYFLRLSYIYYST